MHGRLLRVKALLQALYENSSGAQNTVQQGLVWEPLIALAKASRCPAVTAECVEIARLFLQPSLATGPTSGGKSARDFAAGFKAACREILVAATSDRVSGNGKQGSLAVLKRLALRPVLIESCVCGLLEAAAALQQSQFPQPSGSTSDPEVGSSDVGKVGLEVVDAKLLLASTDQDVQDACLTTMLAMVTKGTFFRKLYSNLLAIGYSYSSIINTLTSDSYKFKV